MIGKCTKAKKDIELIGGIYGVNYDDKTLKNISDILASHRQIIFNKNLFDFSVIGSESLEEFMPFVYRSFIQNTPIGSASINRMVMQILNDEKTADILYDTLEAIKGFKTNDPNKDEEGNNLGKLYYDILERLYFKEENPVQTVIYTDLDIDSHVYSYRKEEATMLFGIYFWQRCLALWSNWREVANQVRREEGRDDLIDF